MPPQALMSPSERAPSQKKRTRQAHDLSMARLCSRMTSATIKLFLPHGEARRLRVGEVSHWTGKALAAPRNELDDLLAREETDSSGVHFLLGVNPDMGDNLAYISGLTKRTKLRTILPNSEGELNAYTYRQRSSRQPLPDH